MACCIHYSIYSGEKLSLQEDNHTHLREARKVRLELGGENVHPDHSSVIRPTYETGLFYHQNCYKK